MNAAHLHLVLNHLPVVGLIFGLGVLIVSQLRRSPGATRVALWCLFAAALTAIPGYLTGEPAEELIERLPGVAKGPLEQHEDFAVFGLVGAVISGLLAALSLFIWRKSPALPAWGVSAVTLVAVASAVAMGWTAKLGGEIRHPEIRQTAMSDQPQVEVED
jgi:uncharacterized membrane protein